MNGNICLSYSLFLAVFIKQAHGHRDYLSCENFDISNPDKFQKITTLLSSLYKKISSNIDKDPSVTHYIRGKNYIPLWVLVNAISMGEISKFYVNMLQHDQNNVAKRIKHGLRGNVLSSCLFFLSPNKYLEYFNSFEILFTDLISKLSTVSPSKIKNIMGLPNNWRRLKGLD